MANLIKNSIQLTQSYLLAPLQKKNSTMSFWYLPEPTLIQSNRDLEFYKKCTPAPFYFMDYRAKLNYKLCNQDNIIALAYHAPISLQINPEAAFQYALGLHQQYYFSRDTVWLEQFFHYANYFADRQTTQGLWEYTFDWFCAKAPWSSALAQTRGAAVMLRAWLHTQDPRYKEIALNAIRPLQISIEKGGFSHIFIPENCTYFEEYPPMPTGVINGFMSSLMCLWELAYWLQESWITDLWETGIHSLEKMLPYYSNGWWSLYDLDAQTPIRNVNSPRYHLLEIHYLQTLKYLSTSKILAAEYSRRVKQYNNKIYRSFAFGQKILRKVLYK